MKISAGVFIVAACVLAGSAIGQSNPVAIFKNVTGSVKVVRVNADLKAVSGMELLKSDKVVSDAGASSGIVFKDGTLLTLGSSSEVVIRDYHFAPRESKYAFSLYLAKGKAIYSSGEIGKLSPDSVSVDTPKATIGVRGTRFIVEAE